MRASVKSAVGLAVVLAAGLLASSPSA
ncbi:MAG: hypothetical protein QOK20_1893, partial [Acidimicrobiaceae bacterium]|nr:hypothetical protein [Acidimicrobiaceae bacterium]